MKANIIRSLLCGLAIIVISGCVSDKEIRVHYAERVCPIPMILASATASYVPAEPPPMKPEISDSDRDGVPDISDECPQTPFGAKVNSKGCWVLEGVYFDTDKYDIKPEGYPVLDDAVKVLKENPEVKVEVQGHTDSRASVKHNLVLSENRAKAVMNYFIQKGISPERLTHNGYGLSKPIESNNTEEGRAKNRRVELSPVLKE